MSSRVLDWINERWPLKSFVRLSLEEEIPGGSSYAYIYGSCVLMVFLLQIITGIWQLFYFVPEVNRAYDSLNYFRFQVPLGWLIHGLHFWGASAMIVLVGLHMSQGYIWSAYKNPRQLTWIVGVLQLLITLALGFTGPVLPWDERGYWEAEVGTSTAGTYPFVGDGLKRLLQGGAELGQLTVSRFFDLHVAIFPGILLVLIGIHLVSFRTTGVSGPWNEEKRRQTGPFWPDQVFKDGLVIAAIFIILVALSVFSLPPVSGPFDILQTSYVPKPEWYFLFLYQSLKAFHGRLELVATLGIPAVVTLLLIFLPFYDRSRVRNPARRPVAMFCYAIFVAWVLVMAVLGYYSKPGTTIGGPAESAQPASAPVATPSPQKQTAAPSAPVTPPAPQQPSGGQGEQLVRSLGCIGCHKIQGSGGTVGPELSAATLQGKTRDWLSIQIKDPKVHNPNTVMPSFSTLSGQQVSELVNFLYSIETGKPVTTMKSAAPTAKAAAKTTSKAEISSPKAKAIISSAVSIAPPPPGTPSGAHGQTGDGANVIGNANMGAILFKQNCQQCHGPEGKDKIPNPGSTAEWVPALNPINPSLVNKDAQTFVNNIDPYIQHGSRPQGQHPVMQMLPFGDSKSLTQQMIANIEAYVLQVNSVDRAQIVHPGIEPYTFFWLTIGLFAVALVGFGIWSKSIKRK